MDRGAGGFGGHCIAAAGYGPESCIDLVPGGKPSTSSPEKGQRRAGESARALGGQLQGRV